MFSPKPASANAFLHGWLEEFCWREVDLPRCLERRNRHLFESTALALEPMFCVERVRLKYHF